MHQWMNVWITERMIAWMNRWMKLEFKTQKITKMKSKIYRQHKKVNLTMKN